MSNDGRLNFGIRLDTRNLRTGAEESKRLLQGIGQTAQKEGNNIDNTLKNIGKTLAGVFAVNQLREFTVNIAKVRGEFQKLEVAFRTLLGSEDKSNALMSQLVRTAATTPFSLTEVTQGAKQLLAYGVSAESVNETLIRLGDIAAGLSIPIGDLAYLYGTTMTQGRLYTQDLNQFLGRGIPLAEELAKQFRVNKSEVKSLVEEGKVGFPEVQKAIWNLTNEGSKFGGLMDAQSKTIAGQISNIEDSIEQMMNELGRKSEGVINSALSLTSNLVENWEKIGKTLLVVIGTYGAYKAAVIAVAAAHKIVAIGGQIKAFLALAKSVNSAKDAMALFNLTTKANPLGLVLGVLSAVVTSFMLFSKSANSAENAQNKLNKAFKDSESSIIAETAKIDLLFAKLKGATEGTEEYEDAKKKILSQYGDYLKGLNEEIATLKDVAGAYDAITSAARKAAQAKAFDKFAGDAAENYGDTVVDAREDLYKALQKGYKDKNKAEEYYWKIVPVLEGKAEFSKEIEDIIKPLDKIGSTGGGIAGGGNITYIDNAARTAINTALQAKKIYDDIIEKGRIKFGEAPVTDSNVSKVEVIEEKQPITPVTPISDDIKKQRQKLEDEYAERNKQIASLDRQTADIVAQGALEIRQARLNAQEDGFNKELEQNKLNYDRLIADNIAREKDMISSLKEQKVLEWKNANPTATKAEEIEYSSNLALGAKDLSSEQQAQIKAFADIAGEIYQKSNKDSLDRMLSDVLTYEQARTKIAEDFEKKRQQLYITDSNGNTSLRAGITQGNVDELNEQEQTALSAIDEQFASKSEEYQEWCNAISDITLSQLEKVLEQAKKALDDAQKNGASGKDLATARAKINTAQNALNKSNAKNKVNPDKRAIKEWEDLYKVLNECEQEFEKIGDTVGGVAGEIINTAGSIMSSTLQMINGIVQLVNMSATGMKGTATAAATAISTVEKASVILTVISAAMQIAMTIIDLFNSDEQKQANIDALQKRIDQLQWELEHQDIINVQKESFNMLERTRAMVLAIKQAGLEAAAQNGKVTDVIQANSLKLSVQNEMLKKSANELAKAYANVAYSAGKALGSERYDGAKKQLQNLAEQQLLIQQQINEESGKKKKDDSAIKEWEQKIQELGQQAISLINDIVEDIIGGSATDIAEQLSDAFFEAFQNGQDYAVAWGDKVNDIVADIMKRMLVQKFLEEPLGKVFDKYKNIWFSEDGGFNGLDAVIGSLEGFANDLNAVGGDFAQIWENLPDSVKGMFTVTADREAESKGIATASQESVDELNGRATAIQGHTYSIMESSKLLLQNSYLILQSVLNIESNTDKMTERIAGVESSVKEVKNTVNDIAINGIKIK